jgi:hypothetical protein
MSNSLIFVATLLAMRATAAPLLLDRLIKPVHTLVYEIPDGDERAEALRFIAMVQKTVMPQAELLDARAADEATLKHKLKGPFVLITMLGESSHLLRLTAGPLPLKIEKGVLRWRDYEAPLAQSRIAFVGKNPLGSGYAVVVAIGSVSLLKDMHDEDGFSYLIYRGKDLARKGCYGEDFSEGDCNRLRETVTLDEAREDVAEFFSTLERVHPNLLAKITAGDYAGLKQRTMAEIEGKADARGNIRSADMTYALAYAAACFKDGHTRVFGDPLSLRDRQQPPFWLTANNGVFRIAAASDPAIQGMELLAVNGAPVLEFLRPALDRCPAETLIAREAMVSFCYLSADVVGPTPVSYKLKLRDRQGEEIGRTLRTVGPMDYLKLAPGLLRKATTGESGTSVKFLDSGRTAQIIYPSFIYSDAEKKRVDEIFRQIKDRRTESLVIDVRGNGGGNSAMGDYLFSYIYAGPFRAFSKVRLRDGNNGPWRDREIGEKRVPRPEAFFSGRIYLMIDNQCFSSTSEFAAMFRDYAVGKILGYETGGLPVTFGDTFQFRLPYSGIQSHASFKQFWPPKPRPGDDAHGVLPDVPLAPELLAPYRKEADPELAFTLEYIRKL